MVEKTKYNIISIDRFKSTKNTPTQNDMEQKLRKASEMYEQQFLGEMLKSMRSTVSESELVPSSMGQKIYQNELDSEYVKAWVGRGGIGLSDLIYNQLHEKLFPQKMLKPLGPMPLDNTKNFKMMEMPATSENQKSFKIEVQNEKSANDKLGMQLQSPWDAKVLQIQNNEDSLSTALLEHANNVQSIYSFKGNASVKAGDQLIAGQKFANIHPSHAIYFGIRS